MTESNQNVNKSHKQYNYCLDFIKGLACIFVVFMHCEFPGKAGTVVQAISRFCVPYSSWYRVIFRTVKVVSYL